MQFAIFPDNYVNGQEKTLYFNFVVILFYEGSPAAAGTTMLNCIVQNEGYVVDWHIDYAVVLKYLSFIA